MARRDLERVAAQRRQLESIASVRDRELYVTWVRAWDQIEADLEDAILAALEGRASGIIREQRLRQALDIASRKVLELARQAGLGITADARRMIQLGQAHTAANISAQLPTIDVRILRADAAQIEQIVQRAQQQITVRSYILQADADREMRRHLVAGVAEGEGPREQARRMVGAVRGAFNGGIIRAQVISRTETIDAYRAAQQEAEQANTDLLKGWLWLCDLGPRTCRSCLGQHGTMHRLDESGPIDHHQGRCTRYPVTRSWSELGFRGRSPEPPAMPRDGERWLRTQSPGVQRSILGATGVERWQAGDWPPASWSQVRRTEGWRDSLGPAPIPDPGRSAHS